MNLFASITWDTFFGDSVQTSLSILHQSDMNRPLSSMAPPHFIRCWAPRAAPLLQEFPGTALQRAGATVALLSQRLPSSQSCTAAAFCSNTSTCRSPGDGRLNQGNQEHFTSSFYCNRKGKQWSQEYSRASRWLPHHHKWPRSHSITHGLYVCGLHLLQSNNIQTDASGMSTDAIFLICIP